VRLRTLDDPDHLPALDATVALRSPAAGLAPESHAPRILLLYGSLRARSFSRLALEEAARLLRHFGAETRIFDPSDLPFPDQVCGDDHAAVRELRELSNGSEGHVWCSPERHGAMSGLMKAQIDHLPLDSGGMRPTQGRTLAVMQVSGGSQSFNAVNSLRLLGRWMRMVTIPNQSSIPKAGQEFDSAGRMRPSEYYNRIVDVMEELVRFTILLRPHTGQLTDRYSERLEVKVLRAVVDITWMATANAGSGPRTWSTRVLPHDRLRTFRERAEDVLRIGIDRTQQGFCRASGYAPTLFPVAQRRHLNIDDVGKLCLRELGLGADFLDLDRIHGEFA